MKDNKDPNKKHYFQPITHEDFAEIMLVQCSKENAPSVTIWEKGESEDLAELYTAVKYLTQEKIIKLKPSGKLVTKITGSTKSGKLVLIKIPIENKINYFTVGKLKFHPEDLTYSFEVAQDIFKSQQRDNFRLNSGPVISIQFKIDDQVFDAMDISAGGTSFEIDEAQKARFAKGLFFKDCSIRFDRKNYYIPLAQVAILLPMPDEEGKVGKKLKVGISFKNLPSKTEEELYMKITSAAHGEEMTKKFDEIMSKIPDRT
jgi:hypothetical protein